ncbi:methionine aminopeptidase [groundwater metagenome]
MNEKEEILEKYLRAGKILSEVRAETVKKVKKGATLLSVAEFTENLIREKGGQPAFPVNISRNDEAAHSTPSFDDKSVFGKDMVKLDIGVHIDGYIADTAVTVDLSGHPELVKAAEKALADAIKFIHAGVNTADIGGVIEDAITSFGYKPVINLTGHGLAQYIQHAPRKCRTELCWKKVTRSPSSLLPQTVLGRYTMQGTRKYTILFPRDLFASHRQENFLRKYWNIRPCRLRKDGWGETWISLCWRLSRRTSSCPIPSSKK